MNRTELQPTISQHEAKKLCSDIRKGLTALETAITKLHDSNGWMLLRDGEDNCYRSWTKCVAGEFGRTKQWADEQIRMAETSKRLSPPLGASNPETSVSTPSPQLSVSVVRELGKTEEDMQPDVYAAAVELAGSDPRKVTASHVKSAAEGLVGDETPPETIDVPADPVQDSDGRDVPPELWDVFAEAEKFKELNRLINAAKLICRPLGESPAGVYLDGEACFKRLSAAQHAAKLAQPHSICGECKGSGCNGCGGNGFLITTELKGAGLTEPQAKILQKRGIDTAGMTLKEASRRIDDIAVNEGWPVSVKDARK